MDEWLKGVIAGSAAVLISTALSMRTTEKLIKEAEIDFDNPGPCKSSGGLQCDSVIQKNIALKTTQEAQNAVLVAEELENQANKEKQLALEAAAARAAAKSSPQQQRQQY